MTKKNTPEAAEATEPIVDPILTEAPVVTIAGVEYPLKRLGMQHAFRVVRVLGRGVSMISGLDSAGGDPDPAQVLQVLVASLAVNEEEALRLIADVLGVDRKALDDAERFPMDSVIDVLEALAKHQDLRSFLSRAWAMAQRAPSMPIQRAVPS